MTTKTDFVGGERWCWFEGDHDKPHGPYPSRDEAIRAANQEMTKNRSRYSTFYVSPCISPKIEDCLPEDDKDFAMNIAGMLDDNCDEPFLDPDNISFSVVEGANIVALREFVRVWAEKYIRHDYLVPDPENTTEVSRTVSK